MIEREREEIIISYLKHNTFASIHDIVKQTGSSEATIRRDFTRLEKKGRILRIRGGAELSDQEKAKSASSAVEPRIEFRIGELSPVKGKIAQAAVSLIEENETIIIDGGSTTYHMTKYLRLLKLDIITNSFAIAEDLIQNGQSRIILPEGIIYPDSLLIMNPLATDPFHNYHATKVFLGVEGINNQRITNSRMDLIQTERSMIEHADEVIILADSRKFERNGNLFLCDLERVSTIITDEGINKAHVQPLKDKGINLIIV